MGRKKSLIKHSEIARATRGLLAATNAAGVIGDIEVYLETGVIKFCVRREARDLYPISEEDGNEWNTVL